MDDGSDVQEGRREMHAGAVGALVHGRIVFPRYAWGGSVPCVLCWSRSRGESCGGHWSRVPAA
jgi:hypothetical protein